MSNIKNLFATPRKAVLSSLCILAILAGIGVGTVFAAGAFAESSAIGAENAQKFAFADAGVDPAAAQVIRTEFDYEQGQFVYEVEFIADGAEYEYWIRSTDGAVVKKEQEVIFSDGSSATAVAQITLDEAKNAALADAGWLRMRLCSQNRSSIWTMDFPSMILNFTPMILSMTMRSTLRTDPYTAEAKNR